MSSSEYDSESEYRQDRDSGSENSDSEYEWGSRIKLPANYDTIISRNQDKFVPQTSICSYRDMKLIKNMQKKTISIAKYIDLRGGYKYTSFKCEKHTSQEINDNGYLFVYAFNKPNNSRINYAICSYCLLGMLPQLEAYISNRNTRIQNKEIIIGPQYDENTFELKDKIDIINNAIKNNKYELKYTNLQSTCSCCKKTTYFYSIIKDNTSDSDIVLCPECIYRFSEIHLRFLNKKANNATIKLLFNTYTKHCDICGIRDRVKEQWFYSTPIEGNSYDVCSDCMMNILPALTKYIDNSASEIHISSGELTPFTAESFPLYANMRQISDVLCNYFDDNLMCEISDVKCSSCQESCCIMRTILAEDLELGHDIKLCAVCLHKLIPLYIAEIAKMRAEEAAQAAAEEAAHAAAEEAKRAAAAKKAAKAAAMRNTANPVEEVAQTV